MAADPGCAATWTVGAGEQVVIRGRSGGGKTTLLNVIAGLATPDAGRIVIDETDVTRLPEAARDRFRARQSGSCFKRSICWPASRRSRTCSWG